MESLKEGVRKSNDDYIIDLTNDEASDLINTVKPEIYISRFQDNIYYFGYKFNDSVGKKERSDFIEWLKLFTVDNVLPSVESFIYKPIRALAKNIDISNDISMIISPRSERSDLTRLIKRSVSNCLPRSVDKKSYEIIKRLPKEIMFDWKSFDDDFVGDMHQYEQIKDYIDNQLMPAIHNLNYFSIAKNVKPKYRRYIDKYLMCQDEEMIDAFSDILDGNILVIDDINTTGSTLTEIIRTIRSFNRDCNIYIFTLIGK